ncbi:MAG: hypothetical protein JKY54_15605 [Flavobacteriales bacterium]|nr:hypothetical protein [Flavobacteriales bacterium]
MSTKRIILVILSTVMAFILAYVSAELLIGWMTDFNITHGLSDELKNSFSLNQQRHFFTKWFIICLIYFLLLIALPLLLDRIVKKLNLTKWVVGLVSLEIIFLIISYFGTPPDQMSTLMLLTACQPVVLVNCIVLIKILKKNSISAKSI